MLLAAAATALYGWEQHSLPQDCKQRRRLTWPCCARLHDPHTQAAAPSALQQLLAEAAAADVAREHAVGKAAAAEAAWQQAEAEAAAAEATLRSALVRIQTMVGPPAELQPAASDLRPLPGVAAPPPQPGGTPTAAGEETGEAAVPVPRASVAVRHVCQAHLASSAQSTACTSDC